MKYEPRFDPKLPKDLTEKQLTSTYFDTRQLPKIEMHMANPRQSAEHLPSIGASWWRIEVVDYYRRREYDIRGSTKVPQCGSLVSR